MSLSSAMITGFTGINSNSVSVDTVGDNLANLNTTAFKNQRTLFETLLYRTVREGEGPSETGGGTLPFQIGSGSQVAAIQRDFRQGGLESTGFQSDLGVDGDGLFILSGPQGQQLFTRDGAFHLDATQTMVSSAGAPLQVFAADDAGNIDTGTLGNLVIPLGTESRAVATTQVIMDGNLDPGTGIASAGAIVQSQMLQTAGGAPATAATALTDLVNATNVPLFAVGDQLTIQGSKGGISTGAAAFAVGTDGSTVGDLAGFMQDVFGIDTAATGGTPGVRVENGRLTIESNTGQINAIRLDESSIVNQTGPLTGPFDFATTTNALGGGVTTTFAIYDSLGNQVDVRIRAVVETKSDAGIAWRFYAESLADADRSPLLGTGTITFDPNGQFVAATGTDINIDLAGSGAGTPASFALDFSGLNGLASPQGSSELIMDSQNGAPVGVLTNYSIGRDGIVTGVYSNQQEQVLGQVALATFINDEGLVALSENTYVPGPNSGGPTITTPQTLTAGAVISGALEQSNVEIAREFITLITAATGISAASRVVRSADEMLQELLLIAR